MSKKYLTQMKHVEENSSYDLEFTITLKILLKNLIYEKNSLNNKDSGKTYH